MKDDLKEYLDLRYKIEHPLKTRNLYGLTIKQEIFCIEYTICNDVREAYCKAYNCSYSSCKGNAYRLFNKRNIKLWIQRENIILKLRHQGLSEGDRRVLLEYLKMNEIEGLYYLEVSKNKIKNKKGVKRSV